MRRLFLSAMVLVLGLFTVTAVFAFIKVETIPAREGEIWYFDDSEYEPEDDWDNPEAWELRENDPDCSLPEESLCRVRLEAEEELEDFLDKVSELSYEDLLEHEQIDLKEMPQ